MRRKYRPYVAIAAGLYLFIMWSAFHWEKSQHLPDGNIFEHREHERIQKFVEDQKKLAESQRPVSTPEQRLNAGPAFVAARYDASHIVFMVAADSQSRFGHSYSTPQKIAAPAQASAHLAGLEELWETDSDSSPRLPETVKNTAPGDEWTLSVSSDSTIPVTIARSVTAPTGCALALGFLATVPEKQQPSFAASPQEYFVVRRTPVPSAETPATPRSATTSSAVSMHVADLADWQPPTIFRNQVESLLNEHMQQELTRIDASLHENAHSPDTDPDPWLAQNVRAWRREWLHRDKRLAAGEGQLDYDLRAFHLTPDGVPRIFVRARWRLDGAAVFLMTAWFRANTGDPGKTDHANASTASTTEIKSTLLSADSNWSSALREGRPGDSLGDTLDFETILNQFDDDHDGWAELLVHTTDGITSHFNLDLYTDLGLVPTHTAFERSELTPDSCAEQAQR